MHYIMNCVGAVLSIWHDHVRDNKGMIQRWANNFWTHCMCPLMEGEIFLPPPNAHCHTAKLDLVPALELKSEIKVPVAITDEPTSSILHTALRTYLLSAAGQLPKTDALMLTIRRQRTAS